MALNLGYIEGTCNDRDVVITVYYDVNWLPAHPDDPEGAPLVDGPRGYCLEVVNISGSKASVAITKSDGTTITANVQKGDPVRNGQGRSRTAAEMAALGSGFRTRGDIGGFQISCN